MRRSGAMPAPTPYSNKKENREVEEGRRKTEKGGEGCWSSGATAEPEGVGVKAEEAGELC